MLASFHCTAGLTWLLFLLSSAIYLCKRTMQNKARLELADYEAVSTGAPRPGGRGGIPAGSVEACGFFLFSPLSSLPDSWKDASSLSPASLTRRSNRIFIEITLKLQQLKINSPSGSWWHTPGVPALRRLGVGSIVSLKPSRAVPAWAMLAWAVPDWAM